MLYVACPIARTAAALMTIPILATALDASNAVLEDATLFVRCQPCNVIRSLLSSETAPRGCVAYCPLHKTLERQGGSWIQQQRYFFTQMPRGGRSRKNTRPFSFEKSRESIFIDQLEPCLKQAHADQLRDVKRYKIIMAR